MGSSRGRGRVRQSDLTIWQSHDLTTKLPVIRHVLLDDAGIALVQHHRAARLAYELRCPLDHAVTLALGLRLDLAGAGALEAFLGAALGLQLGHFACPFSLAGHTACVLANDRRVLRGGAATRRGAVAP